MGERRPVRGRGHMVEEREPLRHVYRVGRRRARRRHAVRRRRTGRLSGAPEARACGKSRLVLLPPERDAQRRKRRVERGPFAPAKREHSEQLIQDRAFVRPSEAPTRWRLGPGTHIS